MGGPSSHPPAPLQVEALCKHLPTVTQRPQRSCRKGCWHAGYNHAIQSRTVVPYLLTGLPTISPVVQRLLMPFTLLTLAAMVRTVQVLMRRALNMQEENDLTV